MTQKDYEIAKRLKERLSEVSHLIDFRVFGSRARGSEDEYSDMDVFIEEIENSPLRSSPIVKNIREEGVVV